jgi:FAD/FMN-containing dehydrogenase
VKGGGHTPAGGFANIQGGVTFDMTSLNATVLSGDKTSVAVGAGAVWNDVYGYLDEFHLAAAGGRNGLVGVGGLLLGGGISHFSPRVGWACDGVVGYEVCTLVAPSYLLCFIALISHPFS